MLYQILPNAVAKRGFSVNTALLSKDRMSFDETTIQALRLVKETIRLHGSPAAVPVTRSMINPVRHSHSKYLSYLESEKQKTAVEAAHKKKPHKQPKTLKLQEKSRGHNNSAP